MKISQLPNITEILNNEEYNNSTLIINKTDGDNESTPVTYKINIERLGKSIRANSNLVYATIIEDENASEQTQNTTPTFSQELKVSTFNSEDEQIEQSLGYYMTSADKQVLDGALIDINYNSINHQLTKTFRGSQTPTVITNLNNLALGETNSTAYAGDKGKAAYDHATAKGSAFTSGFYKITTNAEGHVTAATAVQASDILTLLPSWINNENPPSTFETITIGNTTLNETQLTALLALLEE